MYGWRGRIGLLVPSINTTMEPELWSIAPQGVSVHTARIAGGRLGTFDLLDMVDDAKIGREAIYRTVKETVTPDSDGVFVACTQRRAMEVLDTLEHDLGKPVYSAVQASAWEAFRILGVDPGI